MGERERERERESSIVTGKNCLSHCSEEIIHYSNKSKRKLNKTLMQWTHKKKEMNSVSTTTTKTQQNNKNTNTLTFPPSHTHKTQRKLLNFVGLDHHVDLLRLTRSHKSFRWIPRKTLQMIIKMERR